MRVTLEKLIKYSKKNREFVPFSNNPMVLRDLSIMVSRDIKEGEIEAVIRQSVSGSLLKSLKLYDRYEFDRKESDRISYTYALAFQSSEKTLTGEEVNAVQEKITKNLSKKLNAELRK